MAWIRIGDEFNAAPEWGAAFELALVENDPRLVTELKGATITLYTFSAQQWTDYCVRFGDAARELGIQEAKRILRALVRIGVATPLNKEWSEFQLLERQNFIHIIKSDDKKKRAKRKRDQNRGRLQVPVLLRDGDQCRFCGVEVTWGDTRSDDGREMHHINIEEETTPDNYVVACRGCNQLIYELGDQAAEELPLMDPPEEPIYGSELRKKLSKWPHLVDREVARLGIRHPLKRDVEAQTPTLPPAEDTEVQRSPSTQSQSPARSQREGERRLPSDSRKVETQGRDAKGARNRPHASGSDPHAHTDEHQPSAATTPQPAEASTWHGADDRLRSSHAGNADTDPAGKRRRNKRRRRRR